ncbi:MAG: flagellar hook-length control protein FliK [Pseudomonadota bacterium]
MGALPDMAAPSADLGAASTLTAALPASPVPESAALRDGGNPSAALAALVAQGGDEAMRAERADLPPPLDPLATPTDAPAALPGAARATSDVAAARLQFTAPVVLPARPEVGMDEAFDQRIVWMAEQRIGRAEMRVSPEGAGPIDVRLQIDGHRVTAQFSAANADVRQALEAGMDRLRDLLGQRGMELADAQVGQQHSRPGQGGAPAAHGAVDMADDAQPTVTTLRALRARGLVDEYV